MHERPSGRAPDALRPVTFTRGFTCHAAGSVLAAFGRTQVLCTVSITPGVPPFLRGKGQGWHSGIRHVARRYAHAQRSGGCARKAKRSHPGNPASDRPLPSHGCGSLSPWGDHPQGGLRCAPGGRRYANCSDFRGLRCLDGRPRLPRSRRSSAEACPHTAHRRGVRGRSEGRPGARFGLRRRLYGGNGHECGARRGSPSH